jgi:putative oxidoreductase
MARSTSTRSTRHGALDDLPPYGSLILRLALGGCMVYNGYNKVVPDNALDNFAHYIVSLGLPYWLGYVSALVEFGGGILVLFGLLTRPAACLIAVDMIVALVKVDTRYGVNAWQLSGMLLAMALALACFGGGGYSLDRKVGFA